MSIVSICDNCDRVEAELETLAKQLKEANVEIDHLRQETLHLSEGLYYSREQAKRLTTILRDMCIGHEEGCACVGCREVFRQE